MSASRILVVDDDPVILQLLQVNFEMDGYEVLIAEDGNAGLRRACDDLPDLVLLDVMMPGLTGLEVAAALRSAPATAGMPVMLLSAKAQAADISAGMDVADDYITKPFDPFELLDRVAALLAARPAGDGPPSAGE